MQILNLEQGSQEWLEARAKYFTASEAPVMMGDSPHATRGELLRMHYSGTEKEVSDFIRKKIFDFGHQVEAIVREAIEQELGEDLYPCMVVDGKLSASLDGMTMDNKTLWEHKQFNQGKVDHINMTNSVPLADHWQVQQQLMITGAERCLYTVGNDSDNLARVWAEPDPEAFAAIRAGWDQFQVDLENFEPPADAPQAVGHTMESLPALRIEVTGMVQNSNLAAYKEHALAVFSAINTDLQTDQDFADAESTVKWCKDVEDRLEAAKQHALSQTESIDELFRTIDDLRESARQKRLELNKAVTARKVAIRDEIRANAETALKDHLGTVNARWEGRFSVDWPEADFAAAMKNKRTIQSLRDSVDQVLADAKIAASAQADAMDANIREFEKLAEGYETLFSDLNTLIKKPADDFAATVKLRIAEHKEAEAARQEAEAKRKAEAEERGRQQAESVARRQQAPLAEPPKAEPPKDSKPVPKTSWRVTAVFELEANADYNSDQVAAHLRQALGGFESLQSVTAEEIREKAAA